MMAAGFPVHDATLAEILSAHRPLGDEEPLLPTKGPFAASPDGLSGWVQHAAPGKVCVYARAEIAPGAVAKYARLLSARGLVTLRRCRCAARPSLFDLMARRTDLAFAKARPAPCEEMLSPDLKLLLGAIAGLADAGRPLLSNRDLAAMIGRRNEDAIPPMLSKLKAAHLIAVEYDAATHRRTIEIIDTGARTVSA